MKLFPTPIHVKFYTGLECSQLIVVWFTSSPRLNMIKSKTFGQGRYCLKVKPPPKDTSLLDPPPVTLPSVTPVSKAQLPMFSFLAGPVGEISKSNISIGKPKVVQALEHVSFLFRLSGVIPTLEYQQYQPRVPEPGRRKVKDRPGSQNTQIFGDIQCSGAWFVCKPL